MRNSLVRLIGAVSVAVSAACAEVQAPAEGAGRLEIQVAPSVSASDMSSDGLRATVSNGSSRPLYAKVGDAFVSGEEQDPLLMSQGSGGAVEARASDGTWSDLDLGVSIEGVRYVVLKPGKSYRLYSPVNPGAFRGTARIRLRSSDSPTEGGEQFVDYSNTFVIR